MVIEIRSYSDSDYADFKEMLATYFWQDLKIHLTEEQLDKWQKTLKRQASAEIVFLDILTVGGDAQGFNLYQIDSPESDWCIKEGYGFIREIYVVSKSRYLGYGKTLVDHAENRLKQKGVLGLYLTTQESEMDFWSKMGYQDSGEICSENDGRIFVK